MTNPAHPADLIFHNGQILTMDPASTIVSPVAVSGESIQAVGNDTLPLGGPATKVVDLRGRMLIPGIIDIHSHLDREGFRPPPTEFTHAVRLDHCSMKVSLQTSVINSDE